ncbi:hypothetical protein L3V83_04680 [Thiotrichales bacterium 19X7-9]|nr:hypothetical protein [Thiotrichales bacterium 19X7-9]TNF70209.1 MAG: hypothetical protein EP298_00310 [Gammaproteobacteria bacterium]UTW42043.1 hypothetical protein KFE69_11110 [bacterium SCSIO 12844]
MLDWKLTILDLEVIERLVNDADKICKVQASSEEEARKLAAKEHQFCVHSIHRHDDIIIPAEVWLSDELSKCEKYDA